MMLPDYWLHRPAMNVDDPARAAFEQLLARVKSAGTNPLIEYTLPQPRHYLALIERKPGALDQAAPLQGWDLPEAFAHLRRLLEGRMGHRGKREYIQVLRLIEVFDLPVVAAAVMDAIRLGAAGFDAVKQLVLSRIERRPPRLDLSAYPYLPKATVRTTSAADYAGLLDRRAA